MKVNRSTLFISLTIIILSLSGCSNVIDTNTGISNDKNTININNLQLTQDNTFMSISSSNSDSFNRMIPFYFRYISSFESDEETITKLFNDYFDSVTIYFNDNSLTFTTNEISWTAGRDSLTEYNPILYIMIEIDELLMTDALTIDRIVLNRNDDYSFEIPNFSIEARETISEEIFIVTSSPVMTTMDEELEIYGTYSILPVTGEEIHSFELIFPEYFANIDKYEIVDVSINEDDTYEFRVRISFSEYSETIVFRPFIRIEFGTNQVAYMIPLMPLYVD
ncbi:MAG: hypothetical protein FWG67_08400 [Defluviitaleaceae bacterium]|nr:hypothetical protein [Defluviitaleaceae bacterium]